MFKLIGGGSVPHPSWGRLWGSWPFAVLTFDGTTLHMRMRGLLPFLGAPEPLEATAEDIAEVYPAGMTSRWLGIRKKNGHEFYFWSGGTSEALRDLADAGFAVTWERRPMRRYWSGGP